MSSRVVVLGLVGLALSVIAASNACDPWPDECVASGCSGNKAYQCYTSPDRHSIETEAVCPSDTTCFVAKSSPAFRGSQLDVFCGRLRPDGKSCTTGATSCQGDAIRICTAAIDGKSYYVDLTCPDTGMVGKCTPNAEGTAASCQ